MAKEKEVGKDPLSETDGLCEEAWDHCIRLLEEYGTRRSVVKTMLDFNLSSILAQSDILKCPVMFGGICREAKVAAYYAPPFGKIDPDTCQLLIRGVPVPLDSNDDGDVVYKSDDSDLTDMQRTIARMLELSSYATFSRGKSGVRGVILTPVITHGGIAPVSWPTRDINLGLARFYVNLVKQIEATLKEGR